MGSRLVNIPDRNAYNEKRWSYANAVYLSGFLSDALRDNQLAALHEFLSLYALTQGDAVTGNGTWDDLSVKNDGARATLFGSGSELGGLVSGVLIGGTTSTQNPYKNINEILARLGISSSPETAHQSHFHIYLQPPTPVKIGPGHNLLADASQSALADTTLASPINANSSNATLQADIQGLFDYTKTLVTGEELMFTMDVPYVPAQENPVVLAQAAAPSSTAQPDYLLRTCTESSKGGGG